MQSDLENLIKRVKAATAPDRELDRAIWKALCWNDGSNALSRESLFTASLDAALALVAEKLPGRGSDCLRLALITNDRDHPIIGKKFERDPIDVSEMARRVIVALLHALQSQGDKTDG